MLVFSLRENKLHSNQENIFHACHFLRQKALSLELCLIKNCGKT